jgi:lipopolysaccharide/colanic/teichoic acid biosynthesis glycosyltransferase
MHVPLHRFPLRNRGTWPWKRRIDVGLTLALLPLITPLIALVWLWIRSVSKGSPLFRQRRIGKDGKSFVMYKFRTMKNGCPQHTHVDHVRSLVRSGAPLTKLDSLGDDRLIPGGRFLRAIALDELPQLLNVLRGDMSLVGPRPCLPEEFMFFTQDQKRRFSVPPGITGLWQVGGKNTTTFNDMGELDTYYSGHATLWLDLAILARTPGAIIQHAHRHASRRNAAPTPRTSAHAGDRITGGSLRNL